MDSNYPLLTCTVGILGLWCLINSIIRYRLNCLTKFNFLHYCTVYIISIEEFECSQNFFSNWIDFANIRFKTRTTWIFTYLCYSCYFYYINTVYLMWRLLEVKDALRWRKERCSRVGFASVVSFRLGRFHLKLIFKILHSNKTKKM